MNPESYDVTILLFGFWFSREAQNVWNSKIMQCHRTQTKNNLISNVSKINVDKIDKICNNVQL